MAFCGELSSYRFCFLRYIDFSWRFILDIFDLKRHVQNHRHKSYFVRSHQELREKNHHRRDRGYNFSLCSRNIWHRASLGHHAVPRQREIAVVSKEDIRLTIDALEAFSSRLPNLYTYDIPLTVTAFEAGLRRL